MNMRSKIVAAALGLLVAGGTVADASAATLVKKTVTTQHAMRPVVAKKTVKIVHRFHRPFHRVAAVRVLPGHRIAPRIHLAHAFNKKVVRTTIVR
jgi:hypothetical protein